MVCVRGAELSFPENRDTPIAADLDFSAGVSAVFDWRQEGPQTWDIEVETEAGSLVLRDGGARLEIDGAARDVGSNREYPNLYAAMSELVTKRAIEVDLTPMVHVADAMTLGRRITVPAFHF